MILAIVVSLLLFCAGMAILVAFYLCLVSYVSLHQRRGQRQFEENSKVPKQQGLSEADLQRLPTVECLKEEERTPQSECAVCLEPIQIGDWCRVIPACAHAFHVYCADAWLSKRSVCPMCRTSAAYESGEKNGVNGCAPAAALPQKEGRDHDQELGHLPQPHAASVVVEMQITLTPRDC